MTETMEEYRKADALEIKREWKKAKWMIGKWLVFFIIAFIAGYLLLEKDGVLSFLLAFVLATAYSLIRWKR